MTILAGLRRIADRLPQGFGADGRTLGLGLAAALKQQRDGRPSDAEIAEFLRRQDATGGDLINRR